MPAPPLTREQIIDLIEAEYRYWRDADCDSDREPSLFAIQIGATGALANIVAGIAMGKPTILHHSRDEGATPTAQEAP